MAEQTESVRKDSAVRQIQQKQINNFSGKRLVVPRVTSLPAIGLPAELVILEVDSGDDTMYIWDDGQQTWIEVAPSITGSAPPAGGVMAFAGSSAPSGWLLCDGSSVLRSQYADLFSVIGTTYGSVDGTHFNVPNLKGKLPVGLDAAQTEFDTLAETGGEKTHTLDTSEMPSHTHTQDAHNHSITDPGHSHTIPANATDGTGKVDRGTTTGTATESTNSNTTGITVDNATATNQNTGGGGAHNNLQPYMVMNYIIKT